MPVQPWLVVPSVYPPQPPGLWQAAFNGQRTYPTSTGEDRYRISLAIAGFKPEQVSVSVHQNTLTVSGRSNEKQG